MLQRIQTIYLLVSTLFLSVFLFIPIFKFNSGNIIFDTISIESLSVNQQVTTINTFPLALLAIITIILTIVTILLFKKRSLQMKFISYSIILLIGFYLLIAFYRFFVIDFEITSTTYSFSLIIPLISVILNYMAKRSIKKDDDLVKSVDRIR